MPFFSLLLSSNLGVFELDSGILKVKYRNSPIALHSALGLSWISFNNVEKGGDSRFACLGINAGGGVELQPVSGHLGGREPIVKPTQKGRFFVLGKRVAAF